MYALCSLIQERNCEYDKIAERNEQGMDSGCHRHRPCDTTAPNAALALIIVGRGHLETQSSYVVRADLMEEKPN
jgi:hypothetical protein